jgi:hypothetical protein
MQGKPRQGVVEPVNFLTKTFFIRS